MWLVEAINHAQRLSSCSMCRYASTCQTVGMNLGYFASFTVFLALNDAGFCNRYLRAHPSPVGLLSLAAYLRAWGWAYLAITLAIAALKAERNVQPRGARAHDVNAAASVL